VSRRKRRPGAPGGTPEGAPGRRPRTGKRVALDVAILIAVFAVTVAVAEIAGAANLGVAFGIGQVAFVVALVALLLRG
jgi:hypothetical protein